jgi:hypothetical protein
VSGYTNGLQFLPVFLTLILSSFVRSLSGG